MKQENKFWLFAIACTLFTTTIVVSLAVLFRRQLDPHQHQILIEIFKTQFWYFFSTGVFLSAAFGFTLDWFFRFYIIPLNQLIDETRVMNTVNPVHRIKIDGSREVKTLAELINSLGDQCEAAKHNLDQTIESAKAKTEAEKNILATIMAELTQGALICDTVGRILLYNREAQRVLNKVQQPIEEDRLEDEKGTETDGFIGLYRSVYSLIDIELVQHALKDIQRKMNEKKESVSSHFVLVTRERRRLRVETLPILDEDKCFAGFVLLFTDITHELEQADQLDSYLKKMAKSLRSRIAAIRSVVDLMIQFPEMESREKEDFLGIIASETEILSRLLDTKLNRTNHYAKSSWPLSPILATDFVSTLKSESIAISNMLVEVAYCDSRCMILVDHYSLVLALQFVLECLKKEWGVTCNRIRLTAPGNLVQMDFIWQGAPVTIETLRQWNERSIILPKSEYPLSLKELLAHHNAEIWPHTEDPSGNENCLRLFIPRVNSKREKEDVRKVAVLPKSRPDFYDFDLFNQAGQTPEIEARLLGALTYTIFDTETTGLDPRSGDEIISIGAIRVVNGRLLHTETIHQLVDPNRLIPPESYKFHGITDKMVKGKPTIKKALLFFHRFAQNTVLVAHNAAFDMRMLQMKEKKTGIRFINPVLDTMHLSAVLHPSHQDHDLDAICQRFGVRITKRHDALGDAIVTGEVFLKMIPLLNNKGIFTLKEALVASQRTYYAKKKY